MSTKTMQKTGMTRLFTATALTLGVMTASAGTTAWVAENGNDTTGDGTSGNPFATVTKALAGVDAGGTVYVKAGTIAESAQISVTKNVTIAGDPAASREAVIISGSDAHRVFLVKANVTLRGLTVTHGCLTQASSSDYFGGAGVSCQNNAELVVTNCVFANNANAQTGSYWLGHGAAISCMKGVYDSPAQYVAHGTVRVYDSTFENNTAYYCVGAIMGVTEAVNCKFAGNNVSCPDTSNTTLGTSTLYLGADALVRNCLFVDNGTYKGTTAAASYNLIGLANTAATIENCTFVHNGTHKGVMKSSLIFSHKTATDMANPSESSNLTIRNCLFNDNTVGTSTYTDLFGAIGKVTAPNIPAIAPSGAQNAASSNNLVVEKAEDAQFTDVAAGDYMPKLAWTAVVDQGADQPWMAGAKDLGGKSRIMGKAVDIGALESMIKSVQFFVR